MDGVWLRDIGKAGKAQSCGRARSGEDGRRGNGEVALRGGGARLEGFAPDLL